MYYLHLTAIATSEKIELLVQGYLSSMKKHPFSNALHNLYRQALKHTKYRWLVILGTLLYLVSPLDISPDVFPVIGWIDDGLIVSLLVSEVSQLMSEQLSRKRSDAASAAVELEKETPAADAIPTITVEAVQVG